MKKNNKKGKKYIVNGITLTRVLTTLAMPVLYTALSSTAFLFLIATVLLTDFVDGFLARKWGISTLFGSLADMGADKLLGISLLSVLSITYPIMLLPLVLELLIGKINTNNTLKGYIGKSSQIGRIKMWIIGLGMTSLLMIGATPEISEYLSDVKIDSNSFKEIIEKIQDFLNINSKTLTDVGIKADNLLNDVKLETLDVSKKAVDFINNNKKTIENVSISSSIIAEAATAIDYLNKSKDLKSEEKAKMKDILKEYKEYLKDYKLKDYINDVMLNEEYYKETKDEPLVKKLMPNKNKRVDI